MVREKVGNTLHLMESKEKPQDVEVLLDLAQSVEVLVAAFVDVLLEGMSILFAVPHRRVLPEELDLHQRALFAPKESMQAVGVVTWALPHNPGRPPPTELAAMKTTTTAATVSTARTILALD